MMQSRVRRRDEDDEEGRGVVVPPHRSAVRPTTNNHQPHDPTTSLFALQLGKNVRSLQEAYNSHLKAEIIANPLLLNDSQQQQQQSSKASPPHYDYWNVVGEYRRAMREVELRFGGTVGTVFCFGSNDMFQQALPDLTDKDEQEIDNMTPHELGMPLRGVRQVRAGGIMVGALTVEGKVYTWGACDDGAYVDL